MTTKRRLLKILVLIAASFGIFSIGLISAVFFSSLNISFSKQSLISKIPKAYIIHSGSMEPSIKTGSLIVSYPQDNYFPGNIITFNQDGKGSPTTHRIAFKLYPNGIYESPVYLTGGDANEELDNFKVAEENIIGKTVLKIPYLGYFTNFAKTPQGFILLVIIPATIIVYEELRKFFEELRKIIKKFRNKNSNRQIQIKKDRLPRITAVIPLAGAAIVFIGIASAYFFDTEKSVGNIFQAAGPSLPPIAQTIVINEVYYFVHNDHKVTNSEADSEWAELYNNSSEPISLEGWSVSDNTSCDNIPANPTIPAGGFAILAVVNEEDFRVVWDPISPISSDVVFIQSPSAIGNGLANNDELILRSGSCPDGGIITDHISWGSNKNAFDPSIPMTSRGSSSEREPDGTDTNTSADFTERDPPTPGS